MKKRIDGIVATEILINKMKELWNGFPDDLKPEWCSWTDIEDLEYKVKNIK